VDFLQYLRTRGLILFQANAFSGAFLYELLDALESVMFLLGCADP
jgi:hypothetical protein